MFKITDRFPVENESWTASDIQYTFFNNTDIFRTGDSQYSRVQAHTSSNSAETVINPFTKLFYFLLDEENKEKDKEALRLSYTRTRIRADEIEVNNDTIKPSDSPVERLEIFHITAGGSFIPRLDKTLEFKEMSVALQQNGNHRIRVFKLSERHYKIYTSSYNWQLYYQIVALIPSMFPRVYPVLSDRLKEIAKALGNVDIDAFKSNVALWITETRFETKRKEAEFKKWMARNTAQEIMNLQNSIRNNEQTIDNYVNNVRDVCKMIERDHITILGLQNYEESDAVEDFAGYIAANKAIVNYKLQNNYLYLILDTCLTYIDADVLKNNYINKTRYKENHPNMCKLLTDCYIEETAAIHTHLAVKISIRDKLVERTGDIAFPPNVVKQPHIHNFNCWGDNRVLAIKALKKDNPIGCVEQCIATAMHLNIHDSTVTNDFFTKFEQGSYDRAACIEILATGEMLTYPEYKEYKEKQETPEEPKETKPKTSVKKAVMEAGPTGLTFEEEVQTNRTELEEALLTAARTPDPAPEQWWDEAPQPIDHAAQAEPFTNRLRARPQPAELEPEEEPNLIAVDTVPRF